MDLSTLAPQSRPFAGTRRLRAQLFNVLHKPSPGNPLARRVGYLLGTLIVMNAAAVALETVQPFGQRHQRLFATLELVSTALFSIEYLARLWVCVEQAHLMRPVAGRLRYALQPLPLLDLISLLSFLSPFDLRFLRVARLIRLLRVFGLDEFDASLERISAALRRRRGLLVVAVTLMLVAIYVASALLYQVEHDAQPTVFTSIPATFWWAVETLTTIGYGDMAPQTHLGKLCTSVIAVLGIGVFALPSAIVTAAIIEAGSRHPDQGTHEPAESRAQPNRDRTDTPFDRRRDAQVNERRKARARARRAGDGATADSN